MQVTETRKPPRSFWIIASLALVWNAIGIMTYLMTIMMSQEALEALPEAERALYTDTPAWATGAYAIAVFGGTLACGALLLRKAWAVPLFVVSLGAILIQMIHALLMTSLLEVRGLSAVVLPLLIVLIAAYLVWYSRSAKKKGWIG